MISKIWRNIFADTYYQTEAYAAKFRESRKLYKGPDGISITVVIVAMLCLVIIEYLGQHPGFTYFAGFLDFVGLYSLEDKFTLMMVYHPDRQLNELTYWVSVIFLCYFIIPALFVKFVFRQKLSDYGLALGNVIKDYRIYVIMIVVMLPLVYLVSFTQGFQAKYPFYRLAPGQELWPKFWIWQALYFMQFFALEFFFRGFIVHGLKRTLGYYSVFIMTIPYCMIHFGKPFAETVAAIVAGIVLGTLSLKSRSIFLGVLIHYTVAITMDLLSLWQKGFFGTSQ